MRLILSSLERPLRFFPQAGGRHGGGAQRAGLPVAPGAARGAGGVGGAGRLAGFGTWDVEGRGMSRAEGIWRGEGGVHRLSPFWTAVLDSKVWRAA